jgi:hypothetical protein
MTTTMMIIMVMEIIIASETEIREMMIDITEMGMATATALLPQLEGKKDPEGHWEIIKPFVFAETGREDTRDQDLVTVATMM